MGSTASRIPTAAATEPQQAPGRDRELLGTGVAEHAAA